MFLEVILKSTLKQALKALAKGKLLNHCLSTPQGDQEANLKFKDEEGQVWTFRCRGSPGGISKSRLRNQLQHIIKTSDHVLYLSFRQNWVLLFKINIIKDIHNLDLTHIKSKMGFKLNLFFSRRRSLILILV